MANEPKRGDALQLIFSLFLGLLLVVVIGVGVWTFYPQPYGQNSPEQMKMESLQRQQGFITGKSGTVTPAMQAESNRIQAQIDALNRKMQKGREGWARVTSIVLLVFATILMSISLFLPEHLPVFSNGILLGGLFTILYGTGWSFAGGDSKARFFVVLVALILTIAFGYLRFIKRKGATTGIVTATGATAAGTVTETNTEAFAQLQARVELLESRSEAAAAALRGDHS